MTLLSRANLEVVNVASTDSFQRAINGVLIEPDGTTVAGDGNMVLAVEGLREAELGFSFPDVGPRSEIPEEGYVLKVSHIQDAQRNLPKNRRTAIQNVAITEARDPAKVELTTIDLGGRDKRVSDAPKPDRYPDWRQVMKSVHRREADVRVCVNGQNLVKLLTTVLAACPDKGDQSPLYLEIGREGQGIVVRSFNRETNQRAIGAVGSFNTKGQWLPYNTWEQSVFGEEGETPSLPRPKPTPRKV